MSDEPKLARCPFCGGEARLWDVGHDNKPEVECLNRECEARTSAWDTDGDAIAAWNNRSLPAAIALLRDAGYTVIPPASPEDAIPEPHVADIEFWSDYDEGEVSFNDPDDMLAEMWDGGNSEVIIRAVGWGIAAERYGFTVCDDDGEPHHIWCMTRGEAEKRLSDIRRARPAVPPAVQP